MRAERACILRGLGDAPISEWGLGAAVSQERSAADLPQLTQLNGHGNTKRFDREENSICFDHHVPIT